MSRKQQAILSVVKRNWPTGTLTGIGTGFDSAWYDSTDELTNLPGPHDNHSSVVDSSNQHWHYNSMFKFVPIERWEEVNTRSLVSIIYLVHLKFCLYFSDEKVPRGYIFCDKNGHRTHLLGGNVDWYFTPDHCYVMVVAHRPSVAGPYLRHRLLPAAAAGVYLLDVAYNTTANREHL